MGTPSVSSSITYSSLLVQTCGPVNLSASAITFVTLQTITNIPSEKLNATALSLINIAAEFFCVRFAQETSDVE